MRNQSAGTVIVILALAMADVAHAQARSLTGAWKRISLRDSSAHPLPPRVVPSFAVFADGYFSQSSIPAGRPKIAKSLKDMSKEEIVSLIEDTSAWSGRYTLDGTTLTRTIVSDLDPSGEGTKFVQVARFAGDTLILNSPNRANRTEARFVRVR